MYKFSVLVCLVILSFYGCKKDNKALAYLDEARAYYYAGMNREARMKIDSIMILYPRSYKEIKESMLLSDSIERTVSMQKIDSLDRIVNEYKIRLYSQNSRDTLFLLNQIDSVQSQKIKYRTIVNEITAKELVVAASCQCVTTLRNRD